MLFYNFFFINILTISKTVVFNFNEDLKKTSYKYTRNFSQIYTNISIISTIFTQENKKVVNLQYPIPEFLEEFMK